MALTDKKQEEEAVQQTRRVWEEGEDHECRQFSLRLNTRAKSRGNPEHEQGHQKSRF